MNIIRAITERATAPKACNHPPCVRTYTPREARHAGHPGYCSPEHYEYEEVILRNI